ncbi:MAG: shikimate kinase [Rikenellaceae bacterium]
MLVFLIGYMGCGKSTIGRKLSKRLGWDLVDTDALIEQRAGVSIGEIFDTQGEDYFRKLERDVVDELTRGGCNVIVSTGGGLPIWGDNMERLNRAGETIYISRTAENIASRLSAAGREKRPKLRGLSDEELVAFMAENISQRDPKYRGAKLIIEAVPLNDTEILDTIEAHIEMAKNRA